MEYKYTIINRGEAVVSTNDIVVAREGIAYFGSRSYIRYNEIGIANYELETLLEENHG